VLPLHCGDGCFTVPRVRPGMGETATTRARRLVASYDPAAFDDRSRFWAENELQSDDYAAILRRNYDELAEGDEFETSVSKGCGVPADVTLRVEQLETGSKLGEKTTIEIRPRE
jgi:hypothetical protein